MKRKQPMEVIKLENRIEMFKLKRELSDCFHMDPRGFERSIAITYLVLQLKKNSYINFKSGVKELCAIIDDEMVRSFVYEMMNGIEIAIIKKFFDFEESVLIDYIVSSKYDYFDRRQDDSTPKSISQLALKILDIKNSDEVIDNCMGMGSFIATAIEMQSRAVYYGVEINALAAAIAKIKLSFNGGSYYVVSGNALDNNFGDKKFNKGFTNYPFGMRVRSVLEGAEVMERIKAVCPELSRGTSADWIFNYKLCEMLVPDGIGVAIMSLGGLWNTLDKPIREAFVKYGKVKAVIKLPTRLFSYTSIPVALIVFGRSDGAIRFVDASNEYEEGRRLNSLSEQNIAKILTALNENSDISKIVSIEEIAKNEFNFDPTRYCEVVEEIVGGVPFETIIKSITRGAPLAAKEFDDMASIVPTKYQYMMLANIKNGVIDNELPYLKEVPQKFQKYCINKGDLLLSKNGYPFKVAVANHSANKTILANGNLYIIKLDEEKADPYYVKAFLESEQGIAQLKRISVGSSMPNIGVAQLNKILIPLISIEEQRKISLKYQATLDEIEILRRKIERAKDSLKNIYSALSGEDIDG